MNRHAFSPQEPAEEPERTNTVSASSPVSIKMDWTNARGIPDEVITITFKPRTARGRALSGLRRISRPGLRVYARKSELPRVLGGLGVAVISTSQGLMTGQRAQRLGLGGEVVAFVW